ncbi:MAG TPA: hypothetical protein VKR38_09255 [Usitatibacter sp.]|nr:hypothetical protein [Usitatibacter sp.]
MLIEILKGLSVVAIYIAVLVGGIALARAADRHRRRTQGDRK